MKEIKRDKIWNIKYPVNDAEANAQTAKIASELGLSQICAELLWTRGYRTVEEALGFLKNEDAVLHSPFLLKDLDLAVARIKKALEDKERICIYGDYDVDGVTAVSMMYLYLSSLGADVGYYIPSRAGEGYGLSCAAIDNLEKKGVKLIITVDTGITANEETQYAKEKGIDMVITDHHECRPELPEACAVVNPHRFDCEYPFPELAGVGVVFKLLCGFEMMNCRERGEPEINGVRKICREYADLAAIGTIADVMPIIDENRLVVAMGLRMIATTERKGLAALIDASSNNSGADTSKKRKITSGFIGYGIAPKINAAGRISNASKAVELLLADTDSVASAYAEELCAINRQRQIDENRIAEEAMRRIEHSFNPENDRVIVIENDSWQQGIIGIVASRITEKYGLPSILISFDGTTHGEPTPYDMGKGSGRSVKGMNLVEAMNSCSDLLEKYGGHELAAGLTIRRGNIEKFKERLNEYAKECLTEENLRVSYDVDCEIELERIDLRFAAELQLLEPFGVSNPTPLFALRDLTVERVMQISAGKHTKLLVSKNGVRMYTMCFGISEFALGVKENDKIDLLATVDINVFRNEKSVQLIVQDHRLSESFQSMKKREKERYEEIRAGATFSSDENVIPNRDDFAKVYTLLRKLTRAGNNTLSLDNLLFLLSREPGEPINYIKLKFIIRIMHELTICGVEDHSHDIYRFTVEFTGTKTSIDKSNILKKLKSRCNKTN